MCIYDMLLANLIYNFFQKNLHRNLLPIIFVSVFHRILDFKAGLDFYLGPFFLSFIFCCLNILLKRLRLFLCCKFTPFIHNNFFFRLQIVKHFPKFFFFYFF